MLVNRTITSTIFLVAVIVVGIGVLQPVQTAKAWGSWETSPGSGSWIGPHPDMGLYAAVQSGTYNSNYQLLFRRGCWEPDSWGQYPPDHAYLQDAPNIPFANAAYHTGDEAQKGRDAMVRNDKSAAYDYLGHALHYMTDVCQAFHTSVTGAIYHTPYEQWSSDNWYSGQDLDAWISMHSPSPYSIGSKGQAYDTATFVSSLCYTHVPYLIYDIQFVPNWQNSQDVVQRTESCLLIGLKADKGLCSFVVRGY